MTWVFQREVVCRSWDQQFLRFRNEDFIDLPLSLGDLKPFLSLVVGEISIEKLLDYFLLLCLLYLVSQKLCSCLR